MLSVFFSFSFSVYYEKHEELSFLNWMRSTNNIFTGDEYHFRLGIFLNMKRYVEEHNRHESSYKLELNKFAHLTNAEYSSMLGAKMMRNKYNTEIPMKSLTNDIPDELDYKTKGVVNPVKDQKHCGSCWAFGTIASMESQWALKHGTLYSLSEQCLVDCVHDCLGCHGCLPTIAIGYVHLFMHGKFELEENHPYVAEKQSCKFDKSKGVCKTTGHHRCKANEETLKAEAATNGPYSVIISAASESFRLYKSGVYDNPHCHIYELDHVVCIIGYGVEDSKDYWLVRNSWGKNWGLEGYIKMSRNKHNQCGIALEAVIPVVE